MRTAAKRRLRVRVGWRIAWLAVLLYALADRVAGEDTLAELPPEVCVG